jgi:DNA-dependent RNA polymerase
MIHAIGPRMSQPGQIGPLLRRIPPTELAQAVLSPLQHSIAIGWQDPSLDWRRETAERVGSNIHDLLEHKALLATGKLVVDMKRLRKRRKPGEPPRKLGRPYKSDLRDLSAAGWDKRDLCQVGYWLMYQARTMPYFTGRLNSRQSYYMLDIAHDWADKVAVVRRKFIEADKDQLPTQKPPPDWTSMKNGRVSFISGNHPQCRDALAAAFERGAPAIVKHTEPDGTVITAEVEESDHFLDDHVAGVNALQRVPLKINPFVLDLVEEFGVKLLDRNTVNKIKGDDKKSERSRQGQKRRNWAIVNEDLAFAQVIMARGTFYNLHHCDWRGRVVLVPYLHHQREDRVRSLFMFAEGKRLGGSRAWRFGGYTDREMLMIHLSNCHGARDKESWDKRLEWVHERLESGEIEKIATNPKGYVDLWADKEVDSPFAYAAACKELISSLDDPKFESRMPIYFDATASGLQHLALLSRCPETARLVNLTSEPFRHDVYGEIANETIRLLHTEDFKTKKKGRERAEWWRSVLEGWSDKDKRALVKKAVMTYPYGSSPTGMSHPLGKGFREICYKRGEPDDTNSALQFFAEVIIMAIEKKLPGAVRAMKYFEDIARDRVYRQRCFVSWRSPTGFPNILEEWEPNVVTLRLAGGGEMRVTIGDKEKMKMEDAIKLAPSYVHSLDAAHLMRCVLSAKQAGITSLLTVHDCWGCLAPDAADMHRIFRTELRAMYKHVTHGHINWLQNLADNNGYGVPPVLDDYDPDEVSLSHYGAS